MTETLESLITKAKELSNNQTWEQALLCYEQIMNQKQKPPLPVCKDFGSLLRTTIVRAGINRNLHGEIDKLRAYTSIYQKCAKLYPKNPLLHRNLGSILAHLKNYDRAIESFEEAIAINPKQPNWVLDEMKICQSKQGLANAKKIYFLHIHKAAGTTFVNLARNNLCKFYKQHRNGNPWQDDRFVRFWEWSAEEQIKFLTHEDRDFIANEVCLGKNVVFDSRIAYITILRDPLDRILSQFNHMKKAEDYQADMVFSDFVNTENFKSLQWTNNFIIRTIIHDRNIPEVTREHLEIAKERISKFDRVFFVDTLRDNLLAMKDFGWAILDSNKYRSGTKAQSNAAKELETNSDAMSKLIDCNLLDLELYEFARLMIR